MLNYLFTDVEKFVNFFSKNRGVRAMRAVCRTDKLRFWYCRWVGDRKELWSKITDPYYAYRYCTEVEPRTEVTLVMDNSEWLHAYYTQLGA